MIECIRKMDKDLIVLAFLKYGKIVGRKRFQKLIFLAKYKNGLEIPFNFIMYHYGPYSRDLQNTIDKLVLNGYIKEKITLDENGFKVYSYEITPTGIILVNLLLPKEFDNKIKDFLTCYKNKSTNEIVKESYEYAKLNSS